MLDSTKSWPFGLSQGYFPRFVAITLLVFSGLVFLDVPLATIAGSSPQWLVSVFTFITHIGDAEWILIPSLLIAVAGAILLRTGIKIIPTQRLKYWTYTAGFIFLVTAGPGLLANILKRLIGRARPIHLEQLGQFHFQPIFNDWTFQSIPSGHTSTMFAFATGIMFFFPKLRGPAFILAALVGLSRIIIGMHYPTDIFAGMIFGVLAAFAVRNICLSKDWMFVKNAKGKIQLKSNYIAAL